MKKSKGQSIDSFYVSKKSKKDNKKTKKNKKPQENKQKINLDNEIIIGLTPKKEENKKTKKKSKSKKTGKTKQRKTTNKKKNKSNLKVIKWTSIIIILVTAIVLFLKSSIFNIKQIEVVNNNLISKEEIIKLSTLEFEKNMFSYSNKTIKNAIKENAYIEKVKIKRGINGIVTLDITERTPTYMLKFGNSYVYINNQGYMLEVTEVPLELPIITGFETPIEEIKAGNRLILSDLEKLDDVIKIMNSAYETEFANLITNIDISDKKNYILTLANESKIVQFGGTTNINVKILKIKEIIEKEKGIEGEIYFQNSEKTIFREKVIF